MTEYLEMKANCTQKRSMASRSEIIEYPHWEVDIFPVFHHTIVHKTALIILFLTNSITNLTYRGKWIYSAVSAGIGL